MTGTGLACELDSHDSTTNPTHRAFRWVGYASQCVEVRPLPRDDDKIS